MPRHVGLPGITDLTGHESVQAAVEELLQVYERDAARLVVVEGGPGSGKSTLLGALYEELLDRGADAALVRCDPDEASWPFHTAIGLLQDATTADTTALPSICELLRSAGAEDGRSADTDAAAFSQACDLLASRREGTNPLIMLVDDIQWCDEGSRRLLAYLRRRLHCLPVLLVLSGNPAEALPAWRCSPAADGGALRLWRLHPLGVRGVAALLHEAFGEAPPELVEACLQETAGVPLLAGLTIADLVSRAPGASAEVAVELVRSAAPRRVADCALRAAGRGGGALTTALGSLAVLEPPASVPQVAAALGVSQVKAAEIAAQLVGTSYLQWSGTQVAIAPPVVRRALREHLPPRQRHEAERRLALALASERRHEEAAAHLLCVYPDGETQLSGVLREAAQRILADRPGEAGDLASAFLHRALAEPPGDGEIAEILSLLGTVELYTAPPQAVEHLRRALELETDPAASFDCAMRLAHALALTGATDDAYGVLDQAMVSQTQPREVWVRRAAAEYFFIRLCEGDSAWHPPPATVRTGGRNSPHLTLVSRLNRASQILSEAFAARGSEKLKGTVFSAIAGSPEPSDESAMGWLVAASVLIWTDHLDTADRIFDQATLEARRWNAVSSEATALWLRGTAKLHLGELDDARRLAEQAGALFSGRDWDPWRIAPRTLWLRALEEIGEVDAARQWVSQDLVAELPRTWIGGLYLAARGRLLVASGDVEQGVADLLQAGHHLTDLGCVNPAICEWRSDAARGLTRLGREEEAHSLLEEELGLARQWGANRALAVALRARAEVVGGEEGLRDAESAAALIPARVMPVEAAKCLFVKGRLLRDARENVLAREPLARAHDLADSGGARSLTRRIGEELAVAGGQPRKHRPGLANLLSASEERVARLAASGASNDEIARTLFLARRTVEAHLTHAYRKLDISGRAQLESALERVGRGNQN